MPIPAPQSLRPFTLLIAALGGEGGGVLAEWIVAAATAQGMRVQSTSIPGVAQRTGATTYYLEIWPASLPEDALPVMTLAPVPGQVDVLLASELLEAARALLAGYVTPDRTTLIASTHRVYTVMEKMQMADGRIDPARLQAAAEALARRTIFMDMRDLAQQSGAVINAVLFGALAGSGTLPIPREACEHSIRAAGKGTGPSLSAFALGFERAAAGTAVSGNRARAERSGQELLEFPPASREVVQLGLARVRDYQNEPYARRYLERLAPIGGAEGSASDGALTRETARVLALWMCYEDVIRVADLKTRRSRVDRVRAEVRAKPHEPVHIFEFLKPRLEELTAILPRTLARVVGRIGFLRRFNPPLQIRTTGLGGFLVLRLLATLKPLRPRTARFAEEQASIDRWLAAITRAGEDRVLALEIARCGSLIKGYGDTHARGKANFARIMETLVEPAAAPGSERARAVREAREAALADAEGRTLENVLAARGFEPQAPLPKPLVFVRRPTERTV